MIAYGLSGFAALSYEVLWTRVLSGSLGTTSYAFTTMLTTFLLGIALGSLWASRQVQAWRDPVRALGLIQAGAGLTALVTTPFLDRLPEAFLSLAESWGMSFGPLQFVRLSLAALTMLPTTLLLGAVFPVAVRLCGVGHDETRSPSRSIGMLYSANTVGAIAGSVLTAFVIAPVLGRQWNLAAAALLNAAVGIALLFALSPVPAGARGRARWSVNRTLAAACAALTLAAVIPARSPWNLHAMNAGSYAYVHSIGGPEGLRRVLDDSEMLFVRDDSEATASVWRTEQMGREVLALRINGKVDASTGSDMLTQDLLGHLPMILHPRPRSALIIGLASGITLGAAARHPVERIDCVEISPAVIEASRLFRKENRDVLNAPNVRLIVSDGRNHLLVTDEVYDVITSEPSNPWISGMTNLFTKEFFGIVRGRLAPGGIFCQWINLYDLSPEDLRMVLRTFHDVFPTMSAWLLGTSDLLLLGGEPAETLDLARMHACFAQSGIQEDLRADGIPSHWSLLSLFLTDGDGAIAAAGPGRRVTDDNLALEYSAPRSQGSWSSYVALIRFAASARRSPWPHVEGWSGIGISEAEAKSRVARISDARGIVLDLIAGGVLESAERIAPLQRARELFPGDPAANRILSETETQLGLLAEHDGRHAEAAGHYERALAADPENPGLHYFLGVTLGRLGQTSGAIRELEMAVRLNPSRFSSLADLGVAYANSGRHDDAAACWREALRLKPDDPEILSHLREIGPYLGKRR
jgi:spermidine synthase